MVCATILDTENTETPSKLVAPSFDLVGPLTSTRIRETSPLTWGGGFEDHDIPTTRKLPGSQTMKDESGTGGVWDRFIISLGIGGLGVRLADSTCQSEMPPMTGSSLDLARLHLAVVGAWRGVWLRGLIRDYNESQAMVLRHIRSSAAFF